MLREKNKLVIWPIYLDATKSRREGRLISLKHSVKEPTLKEIQTAAEQLGLNPIAEPDKAYPKSWWEVSGRVLVDKKNPKSETVKLISERIKKNRNHR